VNVDNTEERTKRAIDNLQVF